LDIMKDGVIFSKLNSYGNSCLVVAADQLDLCMAPRDELARRLLSTTLGIGADNLMIYVKALSSSSGEVDFHLEGYNSDGSPVGMCGNGVRCVSYLLFGLFEQEFRGRTLSFDLEGRLVTASQISHNEIAVDLGLPDFRSSAVPFVETELPLKGSCRYTRVLGVEDSEFECIPVNMGNPHCVVFSDVVFSDVVFSDLREQERLKYIGSLIEKHPAFPQRTNVEFVGIKGRQSLDVWFWERGVGVTSSSGSGSCAAVAAARARADSPESDGTWNLKVPGGVLRVEVDQQTGELSVVAPVSLVCSGVIDSGLLAIEAPDFSVK